jgi:hypothetical protein
MLTTSKILLGTAVIATLFLTGCIGAGPTPDFAQPGGIVNVNLGGFKRNADSQLITTVDLTVTITDSNSDVYTPKLTGMFKAFPDHTSQYAVDVQDRGDPNAGQLIPHDGALWVTLALCSPANAVLPLAAGPATISISSPKLTQTNDIFGGITEGTYSSIPITIAATSYGVCQAFVQAQQQNLAYQSVGYLTLQPSGPIGVTVGGGQIEIEFDCELTNDDQITMRLVPLHSNPNVSLIQNVTPNGSCSDGTTGTLTAIITNPDGFAPSLAAWGQGQGTEEDLQLALVSSGGGIAFVADADLPGSFTVTGHYVDLNGDTIPGLTPDLSNEIF